MAYNTLSKSNCKLYANVGQPNDVKRRLDSSNLHFAEVYTKWSLLYVAVPCVFGNRTVEERLKPAWRDSVTSVTRFFRTPPFGIYLKN